MTGNKKIIKNEILKFYPEIENRNNTQAQIIFLDNFPLVK
jgi:hypothetical protein